MWRHYAYQHRDLDGEVFYVGKGTLRSKRDTNHHRANFRERRNQQWQARASGGYSVEILAYFISDKDAQNFERQLIAAMGRADRGAGPLVNHTDGGDGYAGLVVANDLRAKRSALASRPRTEAWVASIQRARKGGGNGGVVRKGDKLPQAWRDGIAAGKRGERNPMFGRGGALHPNRREVINVDTGERWPTVEAAAVAHGLNMKTLYNRLSGHRPNSSPLRFAA